MAYDKVYRVDKYENNEKIGTVGMANDHNTGYVDVAQGKSYEFMVREDAVKVAEFKNWYAAHHSLTVTYRVFERSVIEQEVPLPKTDYLSDRPQVIIEDKDAVATTSPKPAKQPVDSKADKEKLAKQKANQHSSKVEIEIED